MNEHADSGNFKDENSPDAHIPVLVDPLIEQIQLPTDGIMVDATLGHGGHSRLFGQMLGSDGVLIGMDVDPNSIVAARTHLDGLSCRIELVRENFSRMDEVLTRLGIEKVDFILADLGFCSAQLTDSNRGLSFQKPMPLDMRLDDRLETTAADLVNGLDQTALADLIYKYGEERASRRIARYIFDQRRYKRIVTTLELSEMVCRAVNKPAKRPGQKIHPATKTFQALRIAVNDELGVVERLLEMAPMLLKAGGQIAVISFHSLEDRIVKNNFRDNKIAGIYQIMTKKPIVATREEIGRNPRSRSAKLRIARRSE